MTEEKNEKLNKNKGREEEASGPVYTRGSINQIERLVEENLALTKEVLKLTKKIKSYITFQKIVSFFYLLLIVAPIVLGIIYFRPIMDMFNTAIEPYRELLNLASPSGLMEQIPNNGDLNKVQINEATINELLKSLKGSK